MDGIFYEMATGKRAFICVYHGFLVHLALILRILRLSTLHTSFADMGRDHVLQVTCDITIPFFVPKLLKPPSLH